MPRINLDIGTKNPKRVPFPTDVPLIMGTYVLRNESGYIVNKL